MAVSGMALDIPEAFVGRRDLYLQGPVALCLFCQGVEVRQGFADQDFPCGSCPDFFCEHRLQFKYQRVGESTHLIEAVLGDACVPSGRSDAESEDKSYQSCSGKTHLVSERELGRAVPERVLARPHG